jgi:trimeric autotransporter adhesin
MNAAGILTRVAGTSSIGYSGDGGLATNAQLSVAGYKSGVAVDGSGNVYIADFNNNREVAAATGIITTVAGNGAATPSPSAGPATLTQLAAPAAVAVDGTGNLYIADGGTSILKLVLATGALSIVAGNSNRSLNLGHRGRWKSWL